MADIAEIGFKADTDDLEEAQATLEKLPPAVKAVETSSASLTDTFTGVSAAAKGVSTQNNVLTKALSTTNTALVAGASTTGKYASTVDNATGKVLLHSSAHTALSSQAQAAFHSIRSMIEQIALGVPPTQLLTQQINHLSYAASGPGGLQAAFKEGSAAIFGLVGVSGLVTLGVLAIVAALALYSKAAISSIVATADLGEQLNLTLKQVKQLQLAASFKGIDFDDFEKGMSTFGNSVGQAKDNMGTLNGLMIANNMSAKTFMDYLGNVADLVARTNDGFQKQQILREAGLPTTQKWVEFLSQGKAGIEAAIKATGDFNDAAEKNLVQKAKDFDDAWNKATTNFSNYFKSGVLDSLEYLDTLSAKTLLIATAIAVLVAGITAPFSIVLAGLTALVAAALGAKAALTIASGPQPTRVLITGNEPAYKPDKGPKPKTLQEQQNENQQAQQRIGLLGDLASVSDIVTQKQLELNAAGLTGVHISGQQTAAVLNMTRANAENTRVQAQAAVGVFNLNDANKAAADTLQMWIDKKLLDPTNTEQMAAAQAVLAKNIVATHDAATLAATSLPQLQQLMLDSTNVAKVIDTQAVGAINQLSSALGNVFNQTTTFAQGFKNMANIVLQAIANMIIQLMIVGPLMKAAFGAFGFNLSLPGMPTLTKSAKGNVFANDNIQKFAAGGSFTNTVVNSPTYFAAGGKMNVMGEAGPEAIIPLKRGPGGALGVQMYGGSNSTTNDGSSSTITYAPVYQIGGKVTQDDLDAVKAAQADDRKKFTANVANANRELSRRNYKTGSR